MRPTDKQLASLKKWTREYISALETELFQAKLAAKPCDPVPQPAAPTPIPEAKFKVGDPVIRHNGTWLDFICEARWVPTLSEWRYGINYSQRNMCDLDKWSSGGSGFYESEKELEAPRGENRLLGELWRNLRDIRRLEAETICCRFNAERLKYALQMSNPECPNRADLPNPKYQATP